mmetsp:Transcript_8816/g.13569  ORF Transcript_8816/g.13569 Transcript_8816/m.13569 type:complete len:825 (-) Transcript_8816:102-2576(-)|eukprot:CAMPEP_0178910778 /NCGR_PEP_ID=MMETSP0786-20121207/9289_1 /TAXON_ID=186022 /ORGANISM="Thalassionema frauenfeldii, Strain CCMP 1798" /LENGTH=824 /DNA_ID=CAMNT_0020583073 /DNA_START=298 /DNA_END=2772 /DNA_ORIENTATION=-
MENQVSDENDGKPRPLDDNNEDKTTKTSSSGDPSLKESGTTTSTGELADNMKSNSQRNFSEVRRQSMLRKNSLNSMMSEISMRVMDESQKHEGKVQKVSVQQGSAAFRQSLVSEVSMEYLPDSTTERGVTRRELLAAEEMDNATPNHPHPGLQFLPLYFLIKRFPALMKLSEKIFQFRWQLSYPLQRRIPFSRYLRKIQIFCTIGELLLILPFFATLIVCTVYSFVCPSVTISGHSARVPLIFAFATAMHNNLFTLLIGIPFERALFYHKLSARLAYVCGLLHTYVAYVFPETSDSMKGKSDEKQQHLFETSLAYLFSHEGAEPNFGNFLVADSINIGGTLIVAFMTTMIITALPYVRSKVFEVFYYIHLLCCCAILGSAFYHTGILVPLLGCLTWGLDFVTRKIIMALWLYPRKASIRIISESAVEVTFPKTSNFNYNPGQYLYIAVPEIGMFEWHPFTISSSPEQKIVSLHIRKAGSWTNALYNLAELENEISILLEGPYGYVGVDLASNRYKMVMLFSGGIGVTPMQSLCNQLMYEHNTGARSLKKVSFIWTERDPNVMPNVDVVRRSSLHSSNHSSVHSLKSLSSVEDDDKDGDNDGDSAPSDEEVEEEAAPDDGFVYEEELFIEQPLNKAKGIASTLLALVPASNVTDEALKKQYPTDALNKDEEDEQDGNARNGKIESNTDQSQTKAEVESATNKQKQVEEGNFDFDDDTLCQSFLDEAYVDPENTNMYDALDLQVYLTTARNNDVNPALADLPFINRRRPNIDQIFRDMRDEAIEQKERYVAVCVCAPKVLVNMCQNACVKYSDKRVRFDFHFEVFD